MSRDLDPSGRTYPQRHPKTILVHPYSKTNDHCLIRKKKDESECSCKHCDDTNKTHINKNRVLLETPNSKRKVPLLEIPDEFSKRPKPYFTKGDNKRITREARPEDKDCINDQNNVTNNVSFSEREKITISEETLVNNDCICKRKILEQACRRSLETDRANENLGDQRNPEMQTHRHRNCQNHDITSDPKCLNNVSESRIHNNTCCKPASNCCNSEREPSCGKKCACDGRPRSVKVLVPVLQPGMAPMFTPIPGIRYLPIQGGGVAEKVRDFKELRMKAVFFSIEPTTYGPTYEHQIINITATHDIFKELAFNVYVKPTCRIMPSRTKQCGLKFVDGVMYLESIKVESVKARIAMKEFIAYLKTMNDSVLLVSYGDFYDARRLLMMAEATGLLGEFKELVKGIADMKTIYADKGHQGLSHITYYGANNFEDGCEHEETNTASKRVVIFQKLIQFGKESQLEFKDLWKSAKTVDNILEETLLIEENIAKNPDYDVPSGYYVRFKKEIEKLS